MTSKPSAERPASRLTGRQAASVSVALLGPPIVLMLWAHFVRSGRPDSDWPAMGVAALVGLAAILAGPWRTRHKVVMIACYLAFAAVVLPVVGLLAVCSTGDCL
jgi:hypothetical protein